MGQRRVYLPSEGTARSLCDSEQKLTGPKRDHIQGADCTHPAPQAVTWSPSTPPTVPLQRQSPFSALPASHECCGCTASLSKTTCQGLPGMGQGRGSASVTWPRGSGTRHGLQSLPPVPRARPPPFLRPILWIKVVCHCVGSANHEKVKCSCLLQPGGR